MNSKINKIDLLYAITKDVENDCINSGELVESPKLREMLQNVPELTIGLSDDIKKKIYEELSTFIEFAEGEPINGIYEYIGTDER